MRRRTSRRTKRKPMSEINVVPYIDVMLVLLIIFMVTEPMLTQGVKVDLPQAQVKKIPQSNQKPLIVTVNQQGKYFINRNNEENALMPNKLSEVVATTLTQDQNKQAYVRGDKNASYAQVVEVMVLLKKAGVASIGLVTDNIT